MDTTITRRGFLATSTLAGSVLANGLTWAQATAAEFKFKLGTDLPVTHSVNVRLKEAIEAIAVVADRKLTIWGCGQKLGLVYAASPRLSRYSRGLRKPREILMRFSLYQRM